jgi:hypothetical protein
VAADQWFADADVQLWPTGAISGRVVDERSEPVVGVVVTALARQSVLNRIRLASGPVTTTDDLGSYRLAHLPPGDYVVMVPSMASSVSAGDSVIRLGLMMRGRGHYPTPPPQSGGRAWTYATVFSGNATAVEQAEVIELEAGLDRSGVDVTVTPVPAVRVTGVVQGPADAFSGLVLRLLQPGLEEQGVGTEVATTEVAGDGSFTFVDVPAGNFVLDAPVTMSRYVLDPGPGGVFLGTELPAPSGLSAGSVTAPVRGHPGLMFERSRLSVGRTHFVRMPITVSDGENSLITVTLRSTATVTGRFVVELDPSKPTPRGEAGGLKLEDVTGGAWPGPTSTTSMNRSTTNRILLENVLPGRYLMRPLNSDWLLKSVVIDGLDHLYTPIDLVERQSLSDVVVTFTNAGAELSGIVEPGGVGSLTAAAVVAFPVERAQWQDYGLSPPRVGTAMASSDGAYRLEHLPAGRYFVVAVDISRIDDWTKAGFFEQVAARAVEVELNWGEHRSLNLRRAEGR